MKVWKTSDASTLIKIDHKVTGPLPFVEHLEGGVIKRIGWP